MQTFEDTAFHPKGIIVLDDVLIDKAGKQIKDVGYFWDHAEQRTKLAQDILIINYVNPTSGKHYPLEFRRFKKEDQCELTGEDFKKLTTLAIELIDWCHDPDVPVTFTFDSFYTCKEVLNHINSLTVSVKTGEEARGYAGDLKFNRKVEFNGVVQQAQEFAKTLPGNCRKPITLDGQKQWYFTRSIHIPEVDHKVRIAILWEHKNDAEPKKILFTNKTYWSAERVVQSCKYRWTGTETFHRDGKQERGLGDCKLRSDKSQTRHIYLVFLAYSLLIHELDNTLDLHVILDNYATHKKLKVKTLLAKYPRIHRHFISTNSSWLKAIELWFRDLTEKRIRRDAFISVKDLEAKILEYIQEHSNDPNAYHWIAKAEEILTNFEQTNKFSLCYKIFYMCAAYIGVTNIYAHYKSIFAMCISYVLFSDLWLTNV